MCCGNVERNGVTLALERAALPGGGQVVLATKSLAGERRVVDRFQDPVTGEVGDLHRVDQREVRALSGGNGDLELRVEIGPRDALLLDRDAGLAGELIDQLVHHLAVGAGEAVPVGDGRLRLGGGAPGARGEDGHPPAAAAVPIRKRRRPTSVCASLIDPPCGDGRRTLSARHPRVKPAALPRARCVVSAIDWPPPRSGKEPHDPHQHRPRQADRHRRPANLRPVHRAPGPLHLWRDLRRGLAPQRRPRLPP